MVPVLHGLHKYGWDIQRQRMGVVWVLVTLVLNVSGAMAYAFKVC
jgi:adiponectin receptor